MSSSGYNVYFILSQDFNLFFCLFFGPRFCSNPENNPVRAIHKCNLGLCGHFVNTAQSRLRVLLWGHSFLVGASLCSWSLSHLVPSFLSCPNPRSQLPFESSWSSATTAPPEPLLYMCGLARWYCPCC